MPTHTKKASMLNDHMHMRLLCMLGWLLTISMVDISHAGPITFNSALPVSEGVGILRSQVKFMRKTGDVTSQQRALNMTVVPLALALALALAYGVHPKLALFAVLPYVDKRMNLTIGKTSVFAVNQKAWGGTGSALGQLFGPTGVAVSRTNRLYSADWGNHRIQSFVIAQ